MLLKNAGVKGQKMVFLLTDAQIKDEAFLEDVDSVLNTGEVPNLFAMDEKQEITEVGCYNIEQFIFLLKVILMRSCSDHVKFFFYYNPSFFRWYVPLLKLVIRIWS